MLSDVEDHRSWESDPVDGDDWFSGVEVAHDGRVGHQQDQEDPDEGDDPSDDRGVRGGGIVGVEGEWLTENVEVS